jgi:hypothetical protein
VNLCGNCCPGGGRGCYAENQHAGTTTPPVAARQRERATYLIALPLKVPSPSDVVTGSEVAGTGANQSGARTTSAASIGQSTRVQQHVDDVGRGGQELNTLVYT